MLYGYLFGMRELIRKVLREAADWDWNSFGTYYGMASGAFMGYSMSMQHCEYLIDVNTGEKTLYSHLGNGKYNFMNYGEWVDNHSAFRIINTVVKDVPFGGVDNIRNIASANYLVSGLSANSGGDIPALQKSGRRGGYSNYHLQHSWTNCEQYRTDYFCPVERVQEYRRRQGGQRLDETNYRDYPTLW